MLDLIARALRQAAPDQRERLARLTERTHTLRKHRRLQGDPRFETWEATDTTLNRIVHLRCVLDDARDDPETQRALLHEAVLRARLLHPNIASVHAIGTLDDGRPYFTTDALQGEPFSHTIGAVRQASASAARWTQTDSGWSLHRLVRAIADLCDAVTTMHEQGVAHRNIASDHVIIDPNQRVWLTRFERVCAFDASDALGASAGASATQDDLNALGALLATCLTGDPNASRAALTASAVALDLKADPDVVAIAQRVLDPDHADPLDDVQGLASALRGWLEGEPRRVRARALFAKARDLQRQADLHIQTSNRLKAEADAQLSALEARSDATLHEPWWEQLERAKRHAYDGAALTQRAQQRLETALIQDPQLYDARTALIAHHQGRLDDAERHRDHAVRHRQRLKLEHHARALPAGHAERVRMERYLEGEGAVTVVTEPAGAEVEIYRYEERHRRLVEVHVKTVGPTPIVELPLAMGSYLLVLRKDGFAPTRYPVFIERLTHWHGVPPGGTEPLPIPLIPQHHLSPNTLYVPHGPFWAGTFAREHDDRFDDARRVWADGFLIQRTPVTCADYTRFLNAMLEQHGEDEALNHAHTIIVDGQRHSIFARDPDSGEFQLGFSAIYKAKHTGTSAPPDEILQADRPVMSVSWSQAVAYSAWFSAHDGRDWRLPTSFEWEKAARGVDGRTYPWGDHFDLSRCHAKGSLSGPSVCASVEAFPQDESPYGMRGAAGGVSDWCLDPSHCALASERLDAAPALDSVDEDQHDRAVRGGSFMREGRFHPLCYKIYRKPVYTLAAVGFRLMTTDLTRRA